MVNYVTRRTIHKMILPKITVVTPSYNQAQFLEQTILSVIGQNYPNLEYIVMDGGSNDGSQEIIKKYEHHFTYWQSQKDNGQGAAINAGFERATGDIFCWLNSDDMFMPGVLLKIGEMFSKITEPAIVFGNCLHLYEQSSKARGSDVESDHKRFQIELYDYIIQPSSFWNKEAWAKNGKLSESFHYTFDWEWFIRAKRDGIRFLPIRDYLSLYRIHDAHKTGSGGTARGKEIAEIYRVYSGDKAQRAFLKFNELRNRYKWFHNIVYAAHRYSLSAISKLIWLLLFPSLSFQEYKSITRM